jgi:DNA-binding NarL/FixJ family response regulator
MNSDMQNIQSVPDSGFAVAKVVIADDHAMVRDGLRLLLTTILSLDVVGETGDGATVEQLVSDLSPDLLVLDLELPGCHGIELAARIKAQAEAPKILVVTGKQSVELLNRALEAGVDGYVLKHEDSSELLLAIQAVLAGNEYVSKSIAALFCAAQPVTKREREIIGLIASGLSNPDIASVLHISVHTVRTHRKTLMTKLNLRNAVEIAAYASSYGLYVPV